MSDKIKADSNAENKVQTKYDRKMAERKIKEQKEKRKSLILRTAAWVIGIAVIAAVVFSITSSVLAKKAAVKDAYVTIGNHTVTKLEYDYYYNTSVKSYTTNYASILQYMGLDTTVDFDKQQYTDTMTWKDMFDQMTVEQITNTKELIDDAAANSFVYDTTEEYKSFTDSLKTDMEAEGTSLSKYYETAYGTYATEKNVEPFIKDNILASAYYEELLKKNTPSEQEIKDYYEQNPQNYDKVDYRSFAAKADIAEDADEQTSDRAMLEAKKQADAMMKAREGGSDFKELCLQYAAEADKANYEQEETDASYFEGKYYSDVPAVIMDWLYEDGRAEGDITVVEDSANNQYYVVEFGSRYFDEADNQTISDTIASDRAAEYMTKLSESYPVTDNKGELKYLTIPEEGTQEEESQGEETKTP